MRMSVTEFVSAMVIVMGTLCGASCNDDGGSTRTQGDVRALASELVFTVVHDGHEGLADEHHDFIEELVDAHDRLSDEHQALIADFHDDELAARGMTTAHFLHELYYNPFGPEVTEVMSDPKYLEIEDALHGEIGVEFDAAVGMNAALQSAVPNVAGQVAGLVSCTFITVLIVAVVATVVVAGIAAGTIITLSLINSNGANDFCDKCYDRAPQECPHDDSPTIVCDTQGAAETQSEGEIDETKDTYKTHDSNNTGWVCTFQCDEAT